MTSRPAIVPLALLLLGLGACANPTPSPPTAPTLPSASSVTISGLPPAFTIGQSVQLRASVALPDGTQLDATSKVIWQSSDPNVATVSSTGLLAAGGPGDTEVTATFEQLRGTAHVMVSTPLPTPVRNDISGVVHETEPTEGVPVAGATVGIHFVGCPACPHDNQTTTTDSSGGFTLPGIDTAGFTLVVTKPGYETTSYGIVMLPRDQHPRIALPRLPAPSARLNVTIDSNGSTVALSDVSDVLFDMSRSTGSGLRYDVAFGDGASASTSTPRARHVYVRRWTFADPPPTQRFVDYPVRATVTDVFGRSAIVTQTVRVTSLSAHSGHASWSTEASFGLFHERFIRILSQDGRTVSGDSWYPYTTKLTGTLSVGGNIHLVLQDENGSTTLDGPVIIKDEFRAACCTQDRHMLLRVRGGPDDGRTLDLRYYEPY